MIFILECNAVFHRASSLLPFQLPHNPCHSSFCFHDVICFYQWRPTYKLQNVMMIYIRRKLSSSSSIDSLNTKFFNWKKKRVSVFSKSIPCQLKQIFSAEHLFHPAALTAIVGGAMSWQAQNFAHGLKTDYRKSLGFCNWIQSFATHSTCMKKKLVFSFIYVFVD